MDRMEKEAIVGSLLEYHALAFRDVANGEEPFVYSTGNRGPGYFMIKGLVSQRGLLKTMVGHLALKVSKEFPQVEYVAGNATGGMIPGWIMAERLSDLLEREVPYVYVRNTRKIGGHAEFICGDKQNDFFRPGRKGLVMEELVNFAGTTVNSAIVQREVGYDVRHGAGIVFYAHAQAKKALQENGVELISLFTVSELLEVAENLDHPKHLIDDYRAFLADPMGWQRAHGIEPPKKEE